MQLSCLHIGNLCSTAVSHLTVSLMCLSATSPNAASVCHWLKQGCQVCCSLPEHYATSAAQHTGTVLKLKQFPAYHRNLARQPNTGSRLLGRGGGVHTAR